jgi:cell wall-associated NlpC family hydrolase
VALAARRLRRTLAVVIVAVAAIGSTVAAASSGSSPQPSNQIAALDDADLQLAAASVASQAVSSGALPAAPDSLDSQPAAALMTSVYALLAQARAADPSLGVTDTTAVMGPVPYNLRYQLHPRARHERVVATHTLRLFRHAEWVGESGGLGMHRRHDHRFPAPAQRPDGVYVDPALPALPPHPTVAMVAIRAALSRLGQPYVWAAAGPGTFDCSGLVRWAYGQAGLSLVHYTGTQWDQGRLVAPRDVLPGDLILFYRALSHVGIYLGAGWMLNAPYTGQYVSVMPVHGEVAGIVRP